MAEIPTGFYKNYQLDSHGQEQWTCVVGIALHSEEEGVMFVVRRTPHADWFILNSPEYFCEQIDLNGTKVSRWTPALPSKPPFFPLSVTTRPIKPGFYEHYKTEPQSQKIYYVFGYGIASDHQGNGDNYVVYRPCYPPPSDSDKLRVRTLANFTEKVKNAQGLLVPRFRYILT